VGAVLFLFLVVSVIVIPLMMLLMAAHVVAVPIEGQQPPPSFALFAVVLALVSLAFSVRLTMSVPVTTAEHAGPWEILKRSWRLTAGNYWRLLAFILLLLVTTVILLFVAQFVGGILAQILGGKVAPLTLGALIMAFFQAAASATATTLFAVMLARLYLQLTTDGTAQASVPSSGI
jgi:membrane-anchored glycerophosphoryl diester phosphodiesterase (GDPDase)